MQDFHADIQNQLGQERRDHRSYRSGLEYCRLVDFLGASSTGRRILASFQHELNRELVDGTFPYPPLSRDNVEHCRIG